MLFEERKTQFIESLCQDDDHLLMDAQRSVEFRQKEVMLHLLDSYWANFLSVSPSSVIIINVFVTQLHLDLLGGVCSAKAQN